MSPCMRETSPEGMLERPRTECSVRPGNNRNPYGGGGPGPVELSTSSHKGLSAGGSQGRTSPVSGPTDPTLTTEAPLTQQNKEEVTRGNKRIGLEAKVRRCPKSGF